MGIEKNKKPIVLSILLMAIAHSAFAKPETYLSTIFNDFDPIQSNKSQILPITKRTIDPDVYYVQINTSAKDKRFNNPVFERRYMPSDLRNIKVTHKRIAKGFKEPLELMTTKDALSSYLYQDKNAGALYGLYCQRMLAFNQGLPSVKNITVDQAIKEEQGFDFLNQTIQSQADVEAIIRYYNQRLSSRDANILMNWFESNATHQTEQTVKQILGI